LLGGGTAEGDGAGAGPRAGPALGGRVIAGEVAGGDGDSVTCCFGELAGDGEADDAVVGGKRRG